MKYWINYTEEGKILGFYNENQPINLNKEVDNQTWFNNMGMTKIIIDKDKNITFEKVDWKTPEELDIEETNRLKQEKIDRLNNIIVTTSNNNYFDGNESARNNMLSAIISAETLSTAEDTWKLADNTQKLISLVELKEALALSILEVGRIVREYE